MDSEGTPTREAEFLHLKRELEKFRRTADVNATCLAGAMMSVSDLIEQNEKQAAKILSLKEELERSRQECGALQSDLGRRIAGAEGLIKKKLELEESNFLLNGTIRQQFSEVQELKIKLKNNEFVFWDARDSSGELKCFRANVIEAAKLIVSLGNERDRLRAQLDEIHNERRAPSDE